MKFIIHSHPRTQTFWASQVLTTFDSMCLHEPISKGMLEFRPVDDIKEAIELIPEANVGFTETTTTNMEWPGYREVVIFRPVEQVRESLRKIGLEAPDGYLEGAQEALERKASERGVLVLNYPVEKEEDIVKLFQHCLGRKPTKSELRKAGAKIYLPRWQVDMLKNKVEEIAKCR